MNIQYSDRSQRLFNRVREDASTLRHDLHDLVSQTVRNELPTQAQTLLNRGRRRIDKSATLASQSIRQIGQSVRTHKGSVLTGVALLATAGVAAWFLRNNAQNNKQPEFVNGSPRTNSPDLAS